MMNSPLEITILVTILVLIVAFAVRVLVEATKFIYAIAPAILILLFSLIFLYSTSSNQVRKEIKTNYANHIKSIKNKSRSSISP